MIRAELELESNLTVGWGILYKLVFALKVLESEDFWMMLLTDFYELIFSLRALVKPCLDLSFAWSSGDRVFWSLESSELACDIA